MKRYFGAIAVLAAILAGFLATQTRSQYDPEVGFQDSVWLLKGDRRAMLGDDAPGIGTTSDHGIVAVVIIPYSVHHEIIQAAWSYAVRYGADGLDAPNYERAVEIMLERHPTWVAGVTNGITIGFTPRLADSDIAETTPEPEPSDD